MAKKQKVKTSSIVFGHLEKIGAKVFDDYSNVITDLIKGHQGIYALYKKDRLYYVGLATNLKGRIKAHNDDKHKGKWTHFSLYIIRKQDYIRELESLVLRIAYPKGNSIKGKLNHSTDLRPLLKNKLKAQWEKQFNEIIAINKKSIDKAIIRENNSSLKGLLKDYQRIYCTYKGKDFKAKVLPNGTIELIPGKHRFASPSMAGIAVTKKKTINGWKFWKYKNKNSKLVYIDALRK